MSIFLAAPALLLGLEAALRLSGFGYPVHFFVPLKSQPPGRFVENRFFGWRFFPRRLAREPDPLTLSRTKPPGTCRVFVFGESAALGDPEPAYGFGRILSVLLSDRYPSTRFEVVNVSMTAINSHVIREIARDCAPFQADLWVVYMGNNEVVGPYGAGSIFGSQAPGLSFVRASLAVKATRIGQLLDALAQRFRPRRGQPSSWEGMKMMAQEKVGPDDPRLRRTRGNFRGNLESIVDIGVRSGAQVLVASVSSNLRDCPPFASVHRPGLSSALIAEWENWYTNGMIAQVKGEFTEARSCYERAATIDPDYADLQFQMGRCLAAQGHLLEARRAYEKARDLDALRFRADSELNQIIRDVAVSHAGRGVFYLDTAGLYADEQAGPGAQFFLDHVHYNFPGNYRLALAVARQAVEILPALVKAVAASHQEYSGMDECARRLALTDWDLTQIAEEMLRRTREPPFTGQIDHIEDDRRRAQQAKELKTVTDRNGFDAALATYRKAVADSGDDWILRNRYAQLLEASGEIKAANREWQTVTNLMPRAVGAYFRLGNNLDSSGDLPAAERCFEQALQLRPESVEAMNGLGLVLTSEGRFADAARQFEWALSLKPDFAGAHVNWGLLLARQGRTNEAENHYRQALINDPASTAAHVNWAKLLTAQGRNADALIHYEAVAGLRPEDAVTRFQFANALADEKRYAEAAEQYSEAIRLKPTFVEAQLNLGVAMARLGRQPEAIGSFREVIRLKPDQPDAHLFLGLALARLGRIDEAIPEFQEASRLDPANEQARKYLRTALAERGRPPP